MSVMSVVSVQARHNIIDLELVKYHGHPTDITDITDITDKRV